MYTEQGYWLSQHAQDGLRRAGCTIDDVDTVIALGTPELVRDGRRKYYLGTSIIEQHLREGVDFQHLVGLVVIMHVENRSIVTVFYDNNNGVVQQRLAVNSYLKSLPTPTDRRS